MAQRFKGDATEVQFEKSAKPVFDRVSLALDQFWADCYNASPWLLQLYDDSRMPFSDRVKKDSFVAFIKQALSVFPFTGSFESYLFVIRAVFGELSAIAFTVTAPGKLSIDVNATSVLEFEFIGTEFDGVTQNQIEMVTNNFDTLIFRGLSGIETQYELQLLFAELMPAGITPAITLTFFKRSDFIAEDPAGSFFSVVDFDGNQIIFGEVG